MEVMGAAASKWSPLAQLPSYPLRKGETGRPEFKCCTTCKNPISEVPIRDI